MTASLGRDLVVQQANDEFFRRFGGPAQQLVGRPFVGFVHPGIQDLLLRQLAGLSRGGRDRFSTEVFALAPDGTPLRALLRAFAVRDEVSDVSAIWLMMTETDDAAQSPTALSRKIVISQVDARILEGIAAGISTVSLAARVYLSRQGVEYHVTSLFRKLHAPNRTALVSRAYSMGMLSVGIWPPKVAKDFIK